MGRERLRDDAVIGLLTGRTWENLLPLSLRPRSHSLMARTILTLHAYLHCNMYHSLSTPM